ncbi:hypothetical protein C1856_07945 [Eggerthella lenta]|nr:hypothetical protein C1856_07945 [Eggerthella lenta]
MPMRQQAKAQQRMVLLVLIANPLEPTQHRHQALHRQTAIMSGLLVAAITVLRAIMKVCLQHQAKSGLWTIRRFGFRTPQRGMNPFQRMVTKKNQSAMFAAQTLLVMKLLTARPT